MKKITIPADIEITQRGVSTPYTFQKFLDFCVEDTAFGRSMKTLESRVSIRKAFADQPPGSVVELTSTDWETLSEVIKSPTNPYIPSVGEQLLHYMDAVVHPNG